MTSILRCIARSAALRICPWLAPRLLSLLTACWRFLSFLQTGFISQCPIHHAKISRRAPLIDRCFLLEFGDLVWDAGAQEPRFQRSPGPGCKTDRAKAQERCIHGPDSRGIPSASFCEKAGHCPLHRSPVESYCLLVWKIGQS